MKSFAQKIAGAILLVGLSFGAHEATAQKTKTKQKGNPDTIGRAVQQGNGAYVAKSDVDQCMGGGLLGLQNLPNGCLQMTQTKLMVTPSGHRMSVWEGTAPAEARPQQRTVFNSTWTETVEGVTTTYDTQAVTDPNGKVTLSLNYKGTGKGK